MHEDIVKQAAIKCVELALTNTMLDAMLSPLISVRPVANGMGGRQVPIACMATDRIKTIVLYAAADADAQLRIRFFLKLSKQPGFQDFMGQIFGAFVQSWLYFFPEKEPLLCLPAVTRLPNLQISACGEEQTAFFHCPAALKKLKVHDLPLCLLPTTSQTFANADAIILADNFIITIQVTISDNHSTHGDSFNIIEKSLPDHLIKKSKDHWYHVFITDSDNKAASLRYQTLCRLPKNIHVYSGVFNVGRSGITRKHLEAINEIKVCGSCSYVQADPCL